MLITITVRDTPRPGGGKIGGFNRKTGKGFVRPDNPRTATWRDSVRAAAFEQYRGKPIGFAVKVDYTFIFKRPQCHYSASKEHKLKANAPQFHTKKPDRTKLIRSTEDALSGIVWVDDCTTVGGYAEKRYARENEYEGCVINIETLN